MYAKKVTVINKSGVHARPASDITLKAKEFESNIYIQIHRDKETAPINAKSVMKILVSSIAQGEMMEIIAEGADEYEAVESLSTLIASGFGED